VSKLISELKVTEMKARSEEQSRSGNIFGQNVGGEKVSVRFEVVLVEGGLINYVGS
jgi:hypothetical protein